MVETAKFWLSGKGYYQEVGEPFPRLIRANVQHPVVVHLPRYKEIPQPNPDYKKGMSKHLRYLRDENGAIVMTKVPIEEDNPTLRLIEEGKPEKPKEHFVKRDGGGVPMSHAPEVQEEPEPEPKRRGRPPKPRAADQE